MENSKFVENRDIIGMLENIHLLRKLFIKRSSSAGELHFSQVAIMRTIEQNEHCTQATLAEQLNVTPASVATSTKRLEKSGFITKTVDKDNLRCKRLALTEKGREAINRHLQLFKEYDSLIFKNFSEEDKVHFFGYLERLVSEMKQLESINEQFVCPMEFTMFLRRTMDEIPEENDSKNKT